MAGGVENVALACFDCVRVQRWVYYDRQRAYATLVRIFRQSDKGVCFGFSALYDLASDLYGGVHRLSSYSAYQSFFAHKKTIILEIVKKDIHFILTFLLFCGKI